MHYHPLLNKFNSIVKLFENKAAVKHINGNIFSYKELDDYSNKIARLMLNRGLKKGDNVCLHTEKSNSAYATIIACIKVGIIYFCTDPHSPEDRLNNILNQCQAKLIFTSDPSKFQKEAFELLINIDQLQELSKNFEDGIINLENPPLLSDPAYIMFTSGSTGNPKGAVISHLNLNKFIEWAIDEYNFNSSDCHTHLNPLYFDNSVFDIFSTFFSGGSLVPFTSIDIKDPYEIIESIEKTECTVFFSVPSMLIFLQMTRAIEVSSMPSLKKIIFGGEGYPKVRLKELYNIFKGRANLINVYGPTECTCICSSYVISEKDFETIEGYPTIGKLTKNFNYLLIDKGLTVKAGEVGELYLIGPCVGLGYYNQPEVTNKFFVQNPNQTLYNEKTYKTGDLMRLDPKDSNLYFVGRKDFQIKHQGYRIELEEIQHGFIKLEGIEDAVALQVFEKETSKLICFIATNKDIDLKSIRKKVLKFLPVYMVPSKIFSIAHLPKNPNGKTDRKALLDIYYSGKFSNR